MVQQRIIQIGNSAGVILPKTVLEHLGVKPGQFVSVESDKETGSIVITKEGNTKKSMTVSPHFLDILEKVNKEYGQALKKLAQQ